MRGGCLETGVTVFSVHTVLAVSAPTATGPVLLGQNHPTQLTKINRQTIKAAFRRPTCTLRSIHFVWNIFLTSQLPDGRSSSIRWYDEC